MNAHQRAQPRSGRYPGLCKLYEYFKFDFPKTSKIQSSCRKLFFFTCCGGAVNKKISNDTGISTFLCLNHGFHIVIVDVLYSNEEKYAVVDDSDATFLKINPIIPIF